MTAKRPTMNIDRALALRALGWSWRRVGVRLAWDEGRKVAYTDNGVIRAVKRHFRSAKGGDGEQRRHSGD